MNIEDLLVDFDEMSFTPTTLCENPEEYACDWKRDLVAAIERLKAETVKEFAEKVEQAICDNTYPYFDKDGKPVNIWNTDGFDKIDELLKGYEK